MIRSRSKEPPNDKPAPTPLSELNRLAERQYKYHPAQPYRWWEYKPMQAEPPEVFYPLVDVQERRAAQELLFSRGRRFWPNLGVGIILFLFVGGTWLLLFGLIKLLLRGF